MGSVGQIGLRDTAAEELGALVEMEGEADTAPFIIPYSIERHREALGRDDVLYKSAFDEQGRLVGFVILVLEPDGESVEFRRIVIREKGRGYGRRAVALVDEVCRTELRRRRVWLDVFAENARGRHLYEALGYTYLRDTTFQGRTLRVYEKWL